MLHHHAWQLSVASINVNGFGDPNKRRRVLHDLRTNKYDIICLQETHAQLADVNEYRRGWPGPSVWTTTPPSHGRSGGIAVLFNRRRFTTDDFTVLHQDDDTGTVLAVQLAINTNTTINITAVYAPNDPATRRVFFEDLADVSASFSAADHNILLGDFNCVQDPVLDRASPSLDASAALAGSVELLGLTAQLNVIDVWRHHHPTARCTTRRGNVATRHGVRTTGSRIDRCYLDRDLVSLARTTHHPSVSDHDLVHVNVEVPAVTRGRSYWKLNVSLLRRDDFRSDINGIIVSTWSDVRLPPSARWDLLKTRVRQYCMSVSAESHRQHRSDLLAAQLDHQHALSLWHTDPSNDNAAMLQTAQVHLHRHEEREFTAAAVRSRATWLLKGERATRYFCSLEKRRATSTTFTALVHPATDQLVNQPNDMLDAANTYYQHLFTPEHDIDDAAAAELLRHMPSLPADQTAAIDLPISADELLAAIDAAPGNKCPGLDGLPAEFYKAFAQLLVPLLLDVLQDSIATGLLPSSMRTGLLSLMHKKGDTTNLDNYRPLTMLTADYKLIAAVVNRRLQPTLQQLVHPDQKGFVPGRNIVEHLALQRFVRQHCDRTRTNAAILFLDQRKAFDRVHWQWRDKMLTHCNFGPGIRGLISLLHTDASFSVQVNGHISAPSPLLRGTRQGDPLSPTLYALCDEPFACSLCVLTPSSPAS